MVARALLLWLAAGSLLAALATPARIAVAASDDPPLRNGFALEPSSIPVEEILAGGPPRDGIRALDDPAHGPAADSPWSGQEPVVGVERNGESRAYPLALLVWHELANDVLGGMPILVSYCPLCGTAMVFDRRVGEQTLDFGVSGLLYRSDLLMFDRQTDSLWSQISAHAVTGSQRGQRLRLLRSRIESLAAWRRRHPDTSVLSPDTGHQLRYDRSPYGDYPFSERLLFPVERDRRYHPKMPTIGLRLADGRARAYPAVELAAAGGEARETFAGHPVRVAFDPDAQAFQVDAPEPVEVIEGYWFAWMAFHPESSVFVADTGGP